MNNIKLVPFILVLIILGCESPDPNVTKSGEDELKVHELDRELEKSDKVYQETFYVPIYSDVYVEKTMQSSLLAATLSIRNTSFKDSLYVSTIDYYNTDGKLVRKYIDQPIFITPMATINYVIEKDDTVGGPGANFIINLSSDNPKSTPLIQAIMIGLIGDKAFSFSTDAYPIVD